ncbi:maltase 2-like [Sipha flava]|uniref:alpha-glucosidase n=1 Tax=Sipha flava TaxID=143950 RepID=A0A8B8F906_9HEMI|nr:maltase 2-like [Sipha flava]
MCMFYFLFITYILRLISGGIVAPPIKGELDWWQNAVIYEIFPLSFKDSNGDGFGDFNGITEKLDYLVDIGVNAIWLTPFLESPLESGGYDVSDYLKVQDVFGSMEDFENLVNTAHKKNLKVIMDFVPNHTSNKHIWFQESANNTNYTDYYIWKDAKNHYEVMNNSSVQPIVPNNWTRIAGSDIDTSMWIWHETRKQFYLCQFCGNLPDLNFRNEKVHIEMKKILRYWLDKGMDGIRIDALKHIYESEQLQDEPMINPAGPVKHWNFYHYYTVDQDEVYDLIKEWHQLLNEYKQKDNFTRIIMTESYSPNDILFKYYSSGTEIPTNFKLMPYNQLLNSTITDIEIRKWITEMPENATYNVVLQNHDNKRICTLYGCEFIDTMNALSLFLPGVAIVYYGGEIGMEDIPVEINYARAPMQWSNTTYAGFTDGDKNKPWIDVHPSYVTRNVEDEYNDPKSNLNFFKSVSKLRHTDTLKKGGLATYIFDQVYVLTRYLPRNENYTLIMNMGSRSQTVCLADQIPRLYGSLTVVIGSENSNFNPGNIISTDSLTLNPGASIIVTDKYATANSSSSHLYVTLEVLLLCLFIVKSCNL